MAYNLRTRRIREELLEEDGIEDTNDSTTCSNATSGTGTSPSNLDDSADEDFSENDSSDSDSDVENVSLAERLSEQRARRRPTTKLKGKNGFVWDTRMPARSSERQSLPAELVPGPTGDALNASTIEEFFDLLFNNEMIEIIVENTNSKIEEICMPLIVEEKMETYHHPTDVNEIRAYIGVLCYAGLWKSSNVDDNRLWSKANGITFYRCVFTRNRFSFLQSCLRFDVKSSRNREDRFAPIRKLWDIFMGNCKRYYTPSSQCTVDEQLLGFRGRCIFRVYSKDKPDKYGFKIICLNDAETSYMIFAIPYLGKNTAQNISGESVPEYYFRIVAEPIYNTGRSITADNWYTSITGTIRKNKREIPEEFKKPSKPAPGTTFCHAENLTLLSYTPKKKRSTKIVLVISSFMHSTEISEGKPVLVRHYNATKGGTDNFDKLCHSYTVSRRTNRWPQRYFYGMIDQAVVNARVLLKCRNKTEGIKDNTSAVVCLEKLSHYLVKPLLQERLAVSTLRKDIKHGIAGILQVDVQFEKKESVTFPVGQRCVFCSRKDDKKSRKG
ncbi:uncharacterized protein LOC131675225 [Phymastichus coffea]|uniref:uncharacterized protein LOC131675225 n=1 Tax=Phymastichus coffea TaxID=108790 RepID=UPI00273A7FD9|nr:uncharacterized protein LOC131675225 [Phymastichus coffea]